MKTISSLAHIIVGWVVVEGIRIWETGDALKQWIEAQCQVARDRDGTVEFEKRREDVRAMLRVSGFKPSGRSKPAQEYLMRCLREDGQLPVIFPAVDVLNAISVREGLPISMLRWSHFPNQAFGLRIGNQGENFVFNSGGQTIDLENLVVLCGGPDLTEPLGTPIKDSMVGKLTKEDSSALSVLYGPRQTIKDEEMMRVTKDFAENLKVWTGADRISFGLGGDDVGHIANICD